MNFEWERTIAIYPSSSHLHADHSGTQSEVQREQFALQRAEDPPREILEHGNARHERGVHNGAEPNREREEMDRCGGVGGESDAVLPREPPEGGVRRCGAGSRHRGGRGAALVVHREKEGT